MNKQAFLNILKDPENITSQDLEGLEEVIANFPFCQAAHILAAKGASDQGKMLSDKKIRKAAAYASERTGLKKLISKKPATETTKKEPLQENPIPAGTPEIEVTHSSTEPIAKKEEAKETLAKEETKVEKPAISEAIVTPEEKQSPMNEKFFAELQENLRNLHSLKSKAAQDFANREVLKEKEKETPIIKAAKELQEDKIEFNAEKNILCPEPVKEHGENTNLFSSRLDEVMEEKNSTSKPIITEAELLLNYLSFLENHKNSAVKDKKKTEEIIENFIKKDPSIPYLNSIKLPDDQEDKASQSNKLRGGLISENMANIYSLQGKKDKAIEIYQQLMLKNPEKRAYFTAQIEKLKGN